jgi:uncharacterized damage-inducible protein DinB
MHHLHRVLFAAPVWKVTAVPVPKSGLSAYRLAYPCQREPAHYRALRRAFKLRGKLRAEGGIGDYVVIGAYSATPWPREIVGHSSEEIAMCAGLVQTHRAFAYNNAWANHRLLGACSELTQGEFEAERSGFFPSLQGTLNHIYVVDLFYVDALEGGWLGPKAWENPIPFPALAELSAAQASMDQRLIGVCNALTPALLSSEVRINRGSRVQVERCDRLLMHLFQHQIHHRGQAHAMLSGTRIKPPQLDEFFSIAEAPLRASDFAGLGWTEETVWGSNA